MNYPIRIGSSKKSMCHFLHGVSEEIFSKDDEFVFVNDESEEYDAVVYSHFDPPISHTPGVVRIFFDGESGSQYSASRDAPISDAFDADIYIGPTANHKKLQARGIVCIYIPFASLVFGQVKEFSPLDLLDNHMPQSWEKRKFCIYLSSNTVELRESFFSELKKKSEPYGYSVDALGSCYGEYGSFQAASSRYDDNFVDEAIRLISQYKFYIAMENEIIDGYITEKIINAYLAKSVPIYWGTPDIYKFFSPNSIIDINNFDCMSLAIKHIISTAHSMSLCRAMINTEKLYAHTMDDLFSWHTEVGSHSLAKEIKRTVKKTKELLKNNLRSK